jgi:putative sugar O-methyltransferase
MLSGGAEARAAFDLVRVIWDQERWPFDLESHGESTVGSPPQRFPLTLKDDATLGKPYVNYLLSLAALSRHVDGPPRSFLEIGGGFGVLGEIVAARDPTVRYVDVDIPPLITVAAFYLSEVIGDVVVPTNLPRGPLELTGAAAVPSWRIGDIAGPFDVFVNSFSFQEMEPHVVANYVEVVAAIGVRWVVLLNSRSGKRRAEPGREGGALDPLTSDRVVEMFASHGFRVAARHGQPLAGPVAELVVLEAE